MSRVCIVLETPLTAFAVAHYAQPELNLQALGGLVLCVGELFDAPVWNFLAAGSALVRSAEDFKILLRFLFALCSVIAVLFLGLLLTPLHDWLFLQVIGASPEIAKLSYVPLLMCGLWPLGVGYRRLCQGALIRAGSARLVTLSSFVRIISLFAFFALGAIYQERFSGAVIAVAAITLSVFVEGALIHFFFTRRVLPVLPNSETQLTMKGISKYYAPLATTSIFFMLSTNVGAAMMFRMPGAADSLTCWPALSGVFLVLRMPAYGFIELIASLSENSLAAVRTLARRAAFITSLLAAIIGLTSFGFIYFSLFGGLSPQHASIAATGATIGMLWPAIETLYGYSYGIAVSTDQSGKGRTNFVAEAIFLYCFVIAIGFLIGTSLLPKLGWEIIGLYWYMICICTGSAVQGLWIMWRLRRSNRLLRAA